MVACSASAQFIPARKVHAEPAGSGGQFGVLSSLVIGHGDPVVALVAHKSAARNRSAPASCMHWALCTYVHTSSEARPACQADATASLCEKSLSGDSFICTLHKALRYPGKSDITRGV